mmetsp:Transcript_51905/g.121690  ORF Transcript_51905/g.121690 Transcript_51905/m.121690 type:complete len:119 (-) Transcript_51905:21-377(-)
MVQLPVILCTPVADNMTVWEQIDAGKQNTRNKKFLTILPMALLMYAYHHTFNSPRRWLVWANVICSSVVLIAKAPFMHRRRIFGLNTHREFTEPQSPAQPSSPTRTSLSPDEKHLKST